MAASSSYCYSDVTYGVTNNAAAGGLTWGMVNVLPGAASPWVSLQINGLTYRYTMNKDPDTNAIAHVRNVDRFNGGYIFEQSDDWSGNEGGTIQRYFRFPYTNSSQWGDGEIAVEGDGQVTDPTVVYNYKMDIDEQAMLCAASPLAYPTCPGYLDALYKYLDTIDDLDANDPFYDEWVQANLSLNDEVEVKDDEIKQDDDDDLLEVRLGGTNSLDKLAGPDQAGVLAQLAGIPSFEPYYTININGGEYADTVQLRDATLPDNRRALNNLASDATHRSMVRSQYDRKEIQE